MVRQQYAIPNALAITVAIVFAVCRALVELFPGISLAIAQSWFHGFEISNLDFRNSIMQPFILGLVSATTTAWVIGYIFIRVNKLFTK